MEGDDPKPQDEQDIDARLAAESAQLLAEMDALMKRARVIILDQQRRIAYVKERDDPKEGEK